MIELFSDECDGVSAEFVMYMAIIIVLQTAWHLRAAAFVFKPATNDSSSSVIAV